MLASWFSLTENGQINIVISINEYALLLWQHGAGVNTTKNDSDRRTAKKIMNKKRDNFVY